MCIIYSKMVCRYILKLRQIYRRFATLLLWWFHNRFKHIEISVGKGCCMSELKIKSCGKGNKIKLGKNVVLKNVVITITGNNNVISIDDNVGINDVTFAMYDDFNAIAIGSNAYIGPKCLFATCESTSIVIGSDGMIAEMCQFRTSDSHSIIDESGKRVNIAKNITIGDDVWIGCDCLILKGVTLPNNSIVAAKALVTSAIKVESHDLIGGSPAKVMKKNVTWQKARV